MEEIFEALSSGNIVIWIILLLLLVVFVKILKSLGKGIILLGGLVVGVLLIAKFFPGLAEPIADFIRGGWLGEHRPDKPW